VYSDSQVPPALSPSHDESFTAAYLMPPTLLPAPALMSFEED
jgi:hypothetical protein